MSDDSTELELVVAESPPQIDPPAGAGAGPGESSASDDDAPAPEPPEADERRRYGPRVLVAAAVVALLMVVLGTGAWVAGRATTGVPSVTGLRVPDATARIGAEQLTRGTMGAFATSDFQSDVVMQQIPTLTAEVPLGTPVDLLVAVSPMPTVVPSVSLDTLPGATGTLGYALLRPVIYQQLSGSVPYGRVVAQMPRAGQSVMTGQQVALFVSIGPGTGGAVVPSVLGESIDQAAAHIAEVRLVPVLLNARPDVSLKGTVTDQLPAPGTRVPIGSAVPLITSGVAN